MCQDYQPSWTGGVPTFEGGSLFWASVQLTSCDRTRHVIVQEGFVPTSGILNSDVIMMGFYFGGWGWKHHPTLRFTPVAFARDQNSRRLHATAHGFGAGLRAS